MHGHRLELPAVGLVVLVMLGACTAYDPRDYDGAPPSPTPSAAASPAGPTVATPRSAIGSARIVLMVATDDTVTVDATDGSGTLIRAASGTPGDGASAEPYELIVSNVSATTLRLT